MPETKQRKAEQKESKPKVALDVTTSKGHYADGFGISMRDGVAILDFALNTPEGTFRIVNRTIMPAGMLKGLAEEIQKRFPSNTGDAKQKSSKA